MECNKPSLDLPSLNEEEEEREIIKNNRKEEGIHKSLEDDDKGVLLKKKKYNFEPVLKSDAGGYYCKVRRYSLLATKKWEIRRKKVLEKSASYI